MHDKRKIEFQTRLTREDVAGLLEALVEGLKDGLLKVKKSGETLELVVPRVVDLEVEAKLSDERAKFEIEVSWRTNRAENPDDPDSWSPEKETPAPITKYSSPKKSAAKKTPVPTTSSTAVTKTAPVKKIAPVKKAAAKKSAAKK